MVFRSGAGRTSRFMTTTRELTRGVWGSVAIHATGFLLFFLLTHRMALFGGPPLAMDFALAGGAPPPPANGAAVSPTPVADLLADDDTAETAPLALDATTAPQTSDSGSVAVKQRADSSKTSTQERILRIRQGMKRSGARTAALARLAPALRAANAASDAKVDSSSLAEQLLGQIQNQSVKVSAGGLSGGGGGGGGGPGRGDSFLAAVSAVLHEQWSQPTRAEVAKGNPTVGASITVRTDGTVTAFQLTRSSGVTIMDDSVERLLRKVRKLPAMGTYGLSESVLTIRITFTLD